MRSVFLLWIASRGWRGRKRKGAFAAGKAVMDVGEVEPGKDAEEVSRGVWGAARESARSFEGKGKGCPKACEGPTQMALWAQSARILGT